MLIRRVLTLTALMGGFLVVTAAPAHADYIYCPPDNGPCYIVVTGPGGGGGGGGGSGGSGGGSARCIHSQFEGYIACYRPGLGWYNPVGINRGYAECYFLRLSLADNDPQWNGNDPAQGNMYQISCWGGASAGWEPVATVYLRSDPPGYGGLPDPITLAVQAINRLPIDGPTMGLAPRSSGSGLVGLPVWMWTERTARTWGPASASASAGGITVTAWANATRVSWNMGDGTVVVCNSAGTPYDTSKGDTTSPDCGHVYKTPSRSQPGGRYTITGTTTWHVTWSGGGRSGELDVLRSSTSSVQINELQVVVG